MKKNLIFLLIMWFSGLALQLAAQTPRYPASVTPVMKAPYSLFISDYTDPVKEQLAATVIFNDFNESEWTFKLKVRLEGYDIMMETIPGFVPSEPITVTPGEPIRFTGEDWIEYFDSRNMNISGPGRDELFNSGRLPEGGYTLFIQVLDYATGDALSQETAISWWMGLFNPPLMLLPQEDSYINPSSTQISFTWQLFNAISPNDVLGTEYQLTLWEITDHSVSLRDIDPLSAVQNGQALQVFESDRVTTTSYIYGPEDPALELGKAYIYQIQAFDQDGRDSYKNGGRSQFRKFYYGWPQGGHIKLVAPANEHSMTLSEQASVVWEAADNLVAGQMVSYELRVAELEEGEDPALALEGNLWYYEMTDPIGSSWEKTAILPMVAPTVPYAWEVVGYADGQEVSRSDVQTFLGPPLMERFFAGAHRVEVYSINNDTDDLSGTGAVRLEPGVWTDVTFEHLKLENSGIVWTLTDGEILIDKDARFDLRPREESNDHADFVGTQYRLDPDGLFIHGGFEWPLHLASYSAERALVKSEKEWFSFNEYEVTGGTEMDDSNTFELLDPFGFSLTISPSSKVWTNGGEYWMELNGYIGLPEVVEAGGTGGRVMLPYQGKEQLYYFDADVVSVLTPHHVATSVDVLFESADFTVDLSEERSPGDFSGDLSWKGVAYHSGTLIFPTNFDPQGRLKLDEQVAIDLGTPGQTTNLGYVTEGGIFLKVTPDVSGEEPFYFNTFPADINEFVLNVESSEILDDSYLRGDALIPILSETTPFDFEVPMNSMGFLAGYFEGLDGYEFTHNPDNEEQVIYGVVQRAVFEENERLSMTLDLSWPALNVDMTGIRYFKVWGNYNIGFYTPEGIYALDEQLTTIYRKYPITIDGIGAGRSSGMYGFGVSGKTVLGDDVSGDKGAPSFNMYSLIENSSLPGDYVPDPKTSGDTNISTFDMDAEQATLEDAVEEEKENLLAALQNKVSEASEDIDNTLESARADLGDAEYAAEEMIDIPETEDNSVDWSSSEMMAMVPEILAQITGMFPEDANARIFSQILLELGENEKREIFPSVPEIPIKVANRFATDITEQTLSPLQAQVDKVTQGVASEVSKAVLKVNQEIDKVVGAIVDGATSQVVAGITELSPDAGGLVGAIAANVKNEVLLEVHTSIKRAAYDNITFPVTVLLQDQVMGRVETFVKTTAEQVIIATLTPGENPTAVLEARMSEFDGLMAGIAGDVLAFIKPETIAGRIGALANDAVSGISGERILGRIQNGASDIILNYAFDKLTDAAEEMLNQVLGDELGVEIPLDVAGGVLKLMNGGSIRDVLADPITVKVRSQIVDFNGTIFMTEDHPIYGDAFSGAVDVLIKVPEKDNPIAIQAAYMNGRKDGVPFWFVEVGAGAASVEKEKPNNFAAPKGADKVGEDMTEEVSEPANGIKLGIAEIVAMKARVYKHMSADDQFNLKPDANTKFGAYLHLIMFGPNQGDLLRLEVEGQVNTFADGNLILDFSGNAQVDNQNPQVVGIDPDASIKGTIEIQYNKSEKHFFGYATVVLETDGLCGEGSLLVDVKPGYWHVALGNREDRLAIIPGCAGMAYYGWVDLNSDYVEIGAGLGLAFTKEFSLNLGVAKAGIGIDAGINVNAFASVNYKPLTVREIGVFVEMWAAINAWYKLPLGSKKRITLVDIYFYASSIIRFYPSPTIMYGTLKGRVELLKIVKFNFKKDYELNL